MGPPPDRAILVLSSWPLLAELFAVCRLSMGRGPGWRACLFGRAASRHSACAFHHNRERKYSGRPLSAFRERTDSPLHGGAEEGPVDSDKHAAVTQLNRPACLPFDSPVIEPDCIIKRNISQQLAELTVCQANVLPTSNGLSPCAGDDLLQ
ncbi:hypothetical protein AAFF_G00093420 [Aldrovandia affinis]|uniref:Secreted protein n=1 Tax=Aldrovandia affinis TaxID=143900 RepID=A0AAD7T4K5_9TELE|nr:hypothetical protein AAFF_G00093420 [Aldrovandia affinis]